MQKRLLRNHFLLLLYMLQQLRILLFPFSIVYGIVVFIRNKFYDWGIYKSTKFDIPVICVGNLAIGGSGKTPTVEYLVKLLAPNYRIAILSRGYGRKTKGFLLADEFSTAETIGDEPAQYHQKFKNITVAVSEKRVYGINQLKSNHDLIILDDAFQHRAVKAGLNILLFEYEKIKGFQYLLPAGNLRESFSGVRRADLVLITKSPAEIDTQTQSKIENKLAIAADEIVFSSIRYRNPIHFQDKSILEGLNGLSIVLLTGIANPKPLVAYLNGSSKIIKHLDFPDHYDFTSADVMGLVAAFNAIKTDKKIIITTEKDSQRLLKDDFKDLLLNLPIYYLPIEFEIHQKDKPNFDETILKYASNA